MVAPLFNKSIVRVSRRHVMNLFEFHLDCACSRAEKHKEEVVKGELQEGRGKHEPLITRKLNKQYE